MPEHAVAIGIGVQAQTFDELHDWGVGHVPHVYVPLQPFETVPQLLPAHAVAIGLGVQTQTFAVLQT